MEIKNCSRCGAEAVIVSIDDKHFVRVRKITACKNYSPGGQYTCKSELLDSNEAAILDWNCKYGGATARLQGDQKLNITILKDDNMPAFGGWCRGSIQKGEATILLNVEVHFGERHFNEHGNKIEPGKEWRVRTLIETLMHEFGHALEEYFGAYLTDDEIEEIASSYRGLSDDDKREGFDWSIAEDGQSGRILSASTP